MKMTQGSWWDDEATEDAVTGMGRIVSGFGHAELTGDTRTSSSENKLFLPATALRSNKAAVMAASHARWSWIDAGTKPRAAAAGWAAGFVDVLEDKRVRAKAGNWYGVAFPDTRDGERRSVYAGIAAGIAGDEDSSSVEQYAEETFQVHVPAWVVDATRGALADEIREVVASGSKTSAVYTGIRAGELVEYLLDLDAQGNPVEEEGAPDHRPDGQEGDGGEGDGEEGDGEEGDGEEQPSQRADGIANALQAATLHANAAVEELTKTVEVRHAAIPLPTLHRSTKVEPNPATVPLRYTGQVKAKIQLEGKRLSRQERRRHGTPSKRAWRMQHGDFNVFHGTRPTRSKIILLVDTSGSMSHLCGTGMWALGRGELITGGQIAWTIAAAVQARFPETTTYTYNETGRGCQISLIPSGQQPWCCTADGPKRPHGAAEVRGGGTPDDQALLWIEDEMKSVDNTMLIHVCDGMPNLPDETALVAHALHDKGLRYAALVIGHAGDLAYRVTSNGDPVYPEDAAVLVSRRLTDDDYANITALLEEIGKSTNQ
jgi:hypothetical protein